MPIPLWLTGTAYTVGTQVMHETVVYQCREDHLSDATTEPDAGPDAIWSQVWDIVTPPTPWGDWLFDRIPAWSQQLDNENTQHNQPLRRFLRIFGRALNQGQDDINQVLNLWNLDLVKSQYLGSIASTLGLNLSYALTEDVQRTLLLSVAALYRRKGTRASLPFLAKRFLGLDLTVTSEDFASYAYTVHYTDSMLARSDQIVMRQQMRRLLNTYQPVGLVPTILSDGFPNPNAKLNVSGKLNSSFYLGGL